MSAHVTRPTTYPDVNAILYALLSNAQTILGDRFVGLYLYGSLASGDFSFQSSDIDFVAVTTDELPDEVISALDKMHARITASGLKWATKLEGS
ncbi:MAG: nucleotidyltransferase domain-containing protein [Chloroflexi bacterium]|nr:nucleotidyltransferase domain-containing protein [Chloroflexota bacterium]MBI5830049.1 nucleotidyltransferase domain-containing protein [Chloroflexota bacterium]